MDEIEYKLKTQNSTLISHAISRLLEIIVRELKEEEDIFKIPEFKLLFSKCNSDDFVVSTSACQALTLLVEDGICDTQSMLVTFMTCLSSSKNYQAITAAVSQLLILDCEVRDEPSVYNLEVSTQHPFITILNQDKHSWRSVLYQMKLIMHHRNERIMKRSVELLRPVFVYILCNPSTDMHESCKREAWQLVIESNNASNLRAEILLWMCTNRVHVCVDTNCRILELAEISLLKGDMKYCTALVPLIASLTIQLLEYGHEPVQNFDAILNLLEQCHNYIGDIMIILMAEIILICPVTYLLAALHICTTIIDKMPCNITLLNALAASLLKWLAYPSVLCSKALVIAKKLVIKINSQNKKKSSISDDTVSNEVLLMLGHSNRHIRFYMELIRNMYSMGRNDTLLWLENLSVAPIDLRYMCKMVVCGMFLHSDDFSVVQKTCCILIQIVKEINAFASHVLSLLLHKLTKSHDSSALKCLLFAIPEFVTFKENLPIIVHTLDTMLNNGKSLKYFAIQLYAKALEKEPRYSRFVSTALIDTMKSDRSWHSNIACARAIKYVCESRPELCEEFVPLISMILNHSIDLNGGAASALALDCITTLCKSAIIGIFSTWKVLAPKMRKEKRTMVLESLCELFANISSYQFRSSDDYSSFFTDAVTLLWECVMYEDTRVAESALKALRSYSFAQTPLNALPLDFRSELVLPQTAYSGKTADQNEKFENISQNVPGTCWIEMLRKVNKNIQSVAGNLLISYIEEELGTFRSRIYYWPKGEPRDFKYLSEKSVIRAVGENLRRGDKTDPNNCRVIVECLRIFAHRYTKPLPNIKWDFLNEAMQISEEAKEYSLSIASRHSNISQSAMQLTENFLLKYKDCKFTSDVGQLLLNEKHMVFYSNLLELCQAFQPNDLKPFLEASFDYVIDKVSLNDEKGTALFNRMMSSYATTLKSDEILMGNRTLLSVMLEKVFDKNVNLASKEFEEYITAIMELSIKDVERMVSPSISWEITVKKLRNSIAIAAELARRKFTDTPLVWLNEPIEIVASNIVAGVEEQKYLLENIQRVQAELRLEKYCVDWILDLMSRISAIMVDSFNEKKIVFYCDILFISVIYLSGMDCLLPQKESLIESRDVRMRLFPQAISMLADRQIWKSITRQIMNWLNHMRTSSVPDAYRPVFQSSLILLRHEENYNAQWTNYLSVKTCVY